MLASCVVWAWRRCSTALGGMGDKAANPMRDVRVAKLTLNICTGESGDRLQKAAKVRSQPVQGFLLRALRTLWRVSVPCKCLSFRCCALAILQSVEGAAAELCVLPRLGARHCSTGNA